MSRYVHTASICFGVCSAIGVLEGSARADGEMLRPRYRYEDRDRRDEVYERDQDDSNEASSPSSDREYGVADAEIYARYARSLRHTSANGLTDLATVGLDAHGLYGKRAGYAFGLGFALGGGVDGTFAYGMHLSPAGFGIALGKNGYVMLLAGIGFDGATSRVPLSLTFPTEALLAFDVGRNARIGMDAGITWVTNDSRQNGARQLSVGDELDLGTFVRIGRRRSEDHFHTGRGYFLRLDRKGQLGTAFLGISIGLELDVSG